MCGILFHYNKEGVIESDTEFGNDPLFNSLVPIIRERGGDFEQYKKLNNLNIELYSSVLSLRQPLAKQPLIDSRFIIQFNGELYNVEISEGINDGEYLHNYLLNVCNNDITKAIAHLVGEFAYTIIDQVENKVYFGKDISGRKSLCYSIIHEGIYISSCPPWDKEDRSNFEECQKAKIYCYDLTNGELNKISFDDANYDLPRSYEVLNNQTPADFDEELFIKELHNQLSTSVNRRISTIFPLPKDETNSKFALLFSGGIDCTLIAGLCGELCEPNTTIDLLNVSFSNPRANLSYDETPDRMLAIKSCEGLNLRYKERDVHFRLVKINVPYGEYLKAKDRVIKLIYPNDTEMDLSIAIAFYFATSGNNSESGENSDCKVLLSGLGADELFGGYTRHERIFTGISNQTKRKIKNRPVNDTNVYDLKQLDVELRDELQCDLDRLWERNLTRDDKVISCWSKEVRYPFLDETFVQWTLYNVPLSWKLHYHSETGDITRKKALRHLADMMGLSFVAQEPKRAIQFGSKSAKMDLGSGKMKGTDKLQ